ncbi:hypothetical protein RJ640_026770 [Escallonia rubra]|uniref:Beta-glucosidase n=1 Tax=Escallonia rubra TaxID=112253 RepID=A0AA88RWK5_9ASTE|nr:hypothetical protein RJ640_026770 [Escallonia rubra]
MERIIRLLQNPNLEQHKQSELHEERTEMKACENNNISEHIIQDSANQFDAIAPDAEVTEILGTSMSMPINRTAEEETVEMESSMSQPSGSAVRRNEAQPWNHAMAIIDRTSAPLSPGYGTNALNRTSFPKGFIFGAASSAYQVHGMKVVRAQVTGIHLFTDFLACNVGITEKIADRSTGDEAIDSYHRYKIIRPSNISIRLTSKQNDFRDYAELCFQRFGDRVKRWITLNEPWTFAVTGYDDGSCAPSRCSDWRQNNCTGGDSGLEPYIVTHNQILAHAAAVDVYKKKYQATQNGLIGITLVTKWMVAASNSSIDRRAAQRAQDFFLGWYMDPLTTGDYCRTMRSLVGNRLPKFTAEQAKLIKGSMDFLGLNYYTAQFAVDKPSSNGVNQSYTTDSRATLLINCNESLCQASLMGCQLVKSCGLISKPHTLPSIEHQAGSNWLYVYPKGVRLLLHYIRKKYNNPIIYITENGIDEVSNSTLPLHDALTDNFRVMYYRRHLSYIQRTIKEGVDVRGFFAWSIFDNFEWNSGYTSRFGVNYVDFKDGLKRYPKLSAQWFKAYNGAKARRAKSRKQ